MVSIETIINIYKHGQNTGKMSIFKDRISKHFKLKSYGGRSFSYTAPCLWNHLPDAIRQAPPLATFKSNLKTYLFDQDFN